MEKFGNDLAHHYLQPHVNTSIVKWGIDTVIDVDDII